MLEAFSKAAKLAPSNFDYQMRMGEAYYDLASLTGKVLLFTGINYVRVPRLYYKMKF